MSDQARIIISHRRAPRLSLWDKIKLWRAIKTMDLTKLKSRKLWIAAGVAAASVILNGLGFSQQLIDQLVNLALGYLAAQGAVDVANALKPQAASRKPAE